MIRFAVNDNGIIFQAQVFQSDSKLSQRMDRWYCIFELQYPLSAEAFSISTVVPKAGIMTTSSFFSSDQGMN